MNSNPSGVKVGGHTAEWSYGNLKKVGMVEQEQDRTLTEKQNIRNWIVSISIFKIHFWFLNWAPSIWQMSDMDPVISLTHMVQISVKMSLCQSPLMDSVYQGQDSD